jgi:hypothetical protein
VSEQAPLYPTTTSFGKIRGFTLQVLQFLARHGEMRVSELCETFQKSPQYLIRYLYNMQNYGLVLNQDCFWKLTEKGALFNSYFEKIVEKDSIYMKEVRKKLERNKKVTILRVQKQVSLENWSRNHDLSDCEKEVVDTLIKHYNETGSKYVFFNDPYSFAEKIGFNLDVTKEALQKLRMDNVIYLIRDKTHGCWKLGMKKAFVEALTVANTTG